MRARARGGVSWPNLLSWGASAHSQDAADHLFLYYRKGSGEEVPSAVRAMVPGWERVLQDES